MDKDVGLRTEQIADLACYIAHPKFMNLSDPGTGKTPSVVVYQWFLWDEKQVGTAWVMPKRLLKKNKREILRFTKFEDKDVCILDGTAAQIKKQLASGAKVFLMGFSRWRLSWRQLPSYVTAMMVDEFHKGFKSATSAQTLAMFAAFDSRRFEYFLIMTGTLISGKLTSAYPAIHVIDPRYYANATAFEYQHGIFDWEGKIIGWQNHEKLSKIFGSHGIRRTFKDLFGEQAIVIIPEVTEMHPRQRQLYDEFHDRAIVDLEKFFLTGMEPGVAFMRARQLMEHPNRFPDLTSPGQFIDAIPGLTPGKEELLDLHLEDHINTGAPLIIYTSMIPQQENICRMLEERKLRWGRIYGGMSINQSDAVALAFEKGDIDYIVCSPQCADVGFNWQFSGNREVDHIIFMTMDYLDTTFLQAIGRAIRGPRTLPLRISVLEYENSVDQHILRIIYDKSVEANKVDPTRPILQLSGYEKDYSIAA